LVHFGLKNASGKSYFNYIFTKKSPTNLTSLLVIKMSGFSHTIWGRHKGPMGDTSQRQAQGPHKYASGVQAQGPINTSLTAE